MVIVDQKIGFLGGLDLCYGRYDTSKHHIFDHEIGYYPGIEYNNIRVQDIIKVR
jgi:phospholipase D1/2